jgi:anti-sigma regulatory factor (Ser/Thr protein kinase)
METVIWKTMPSVVVPVAEPSQVSEARRVATSLAFAAGFGEDDSGKISLAATEAATNLAKYSTQGELLLNTVHRGSGMGLEIISVDKGPGIADLDACLRDGHSTSGSPGTGLGALRRLASVFDIYSAAGIGTTVLCRFWPRQAARVSRPLEAGAVAVPHPGESVCGDAWAVRQDPGCLSLMVADGLGHGPLAADAASRAVEAFRQAPGTPTEILHRAHGPMRSTRGAAAAVARIDVEQARVRYAGIGNITGLISAPQGNHYMVSHAGILGHEMIRLQEFTYELPPDALLVMYSDGLTSHCAPDSWPGLRGHDPSLIAGMLYRLCTRGRDDATVLVARVSK